jgi:hypothetical protein
VLGDATNHGVAAVERPGARTDVPAYDRADAVGADHRVPVNPLPILEGHTHLVYGAHCDVVVHRQPLGEQLVQSRPLNDQHRSARAPGQRLDIDVRQRAPAGVAEHSVPDRRCDGAHRRTVP